MTLIEQLLEVADAYAQHAGLETSTLSWRLFGDTKKLGAIKLDGRDLQTARFEKAMHWLSDEWPADLTWPAGVKRPAVVRKPASEAQEGSAA